MYDFKLFKVFPKTSGLGQRVGYHVTSKRVVFCSDETGVCFENVRETSVSKTFEGKNEKQKRYRLLHAMKFGFIQIGRKNFSAIVRS